MLNNGSEALKMFGIGFENNQLTMEELVALRYRIDPNFAPALAAELDAIIEAANCE